MELILFLIIVVYLTCKVGSDRAGQKAVQKEINERIKKRRDVVDRITNKEFENDIDIDDYKDLINRCLLEIFNTDDYYHIGQLVRISDDFYRRIILSQYGFVLHSDAVFSSPDKINYETYDGFYKYYKWIENELHERGVNGSYKVERYCATFYNKPYDFDDSVKRDLKIHKYSREVVWDFEERYC